MMSPPCSHACGPGPTATDRIPSVGAPAASSSLYLRMRPLRIVLVMIEPPLPFGNAAARWFYVLLKGLVERGHHVTALAACSKPAEMEQARGLFPAPGYDLRLFPFPSREG